MRRRAVVVAANPSLLPSLSTLALRLGLARPARLVLEVEP